MFTFRFSLILLFLFQIGKAGAQSPSNRLDVVQIEKYLQKSYQEYMEAINTDDRETEEKFLKNMLTPEMQEKRARLACATDSDPMIRAQDVPSSPYGASTCPAVGTKCHTARIPKIRQPISHYVSRQIPWEKYVFRT